ncbi:short chain dehydrogenase [Roseovarius albus]|uniref:Short chain dehydrogenase n=1 Tax=Roseovarius albus TaxID=1247867 RepID=A0A1X6YCN6_9RHOB|nr:hypothetical protein [Roseovarius albus]SLN16661.1 short chain dehydrogenase [Roseovarius albus]
MMRPASVDAVITTAGLAGFDSFAEMDDVAYELALINNQMGQFNLALIGQKNLKDGGSVTLAAGILSRQPMPIS